MVRLRVKLGQYGGGNGNGELGIGNWELLVDMRFELVDFGFL